MRSRDQMSFPANASICTIVLILRRRRSSILILKIFHHKLIAIATLLNSLCIQAVPSEVGFGAIQALYMRTPSVQSSSTEDVP